LDAGANWPPTGDRRPDTSDHGPGMGTVAQWDRELVRRAKAVKFVSIDTMPLARDICALPA